MGKQQKLEQVAYFYIKEKILDGFWHSEDHIIESAISADLDISRSPIRAALSALEKESVVQFIPYRGYYVAKDVHLTDDIGFYLTYLLVLWYRLTEVLQKSHDDHAVDEATIDRLLENISNTVAADDKHRFVKYVEELLTHLFAHSEKPLYVETLLTNFHRITDQLLPKDDAIDSEVRHLILVREYITFKNVTILFKENRFTDTRVLIELLIRFFAGQLLKHGLISEQYSPYTIH